MATGREWGAAESSGRVGGPGKRGKGCGESQQVQRGRPVDRSGDTVITKSTTHLIEQASPGVPGGLGQLGRCQLFFLPSFRIGNKNLLIPRARVQD